MTTPRSELEDLAAEGALDGLDVTRVGDAVRLRGHASARRFYRVTGRGGLTAILVVYPAHGADPEVDRFERTTKWFQNAGVPVPRIWQRGRRALVVADAGEVMLDAIQGPALSRLYAQAIQALCRLQAHGELLPPPNPDWQLDRSRFDFELGHLEEHGFGGWLPPDGGGAQRGELYADLAQRLDAMPRVLCHRDFHSRNLMVHRGRVVVVDLQDVMSGPVFYDAASLLLDNYVDVPSGIITDSLGQLSRRSRLSHHVQSGAAVPSWPRGLSDGDRQAFVLTALQRSLKALGTFSYQVHVAGNAEFRQYVPRTWTHVRRLLIDLGWEHRLDALSAFGKLPA